MTRYSLQTGLLCCFLLFTHLNPSSIKTFFSQYHTSRASICNLASWELTICRGSKVSHNAYKESPSNALSLFSPSPVLIMNDTQSLPHGIRCTGKQRPSRNQRSHVKRRYTPTLLGNYKCSPIHHHKQLCFNTPTNPPQAVRPAPQPP